MGDDEARGWRRFAPGLAVLIRYDRRWLRGDVIAGITVTAYLVPQVMAYAEIIGLPPVAGLWAGLAPMLIYAILGSSRQLSVGPESTTALMTAAAIAAVAGQVGASQRATAAAVIALAVGVVCLLGWVARLGFVANLLSKPVLVGYLAGIGLLMVVSQYGRLTKLSIVGANPLAETVSLVEQLPAAHLPTPRPGCGGGGCVVCAAPLVAHLAWPVAGDVAGRSPGGLDPNRVQWAGRDRGGPYWRPEPGDAQS